MTNLIVLLLAYAFGYFLSYSMLRIEHESEGKPYTRGDRLLNVTLSLLSWAFVLFILTLSWIRNIGQTGYWAKPIKEPKKEDAVK